MIQVANGLTVYDGYAVSSDSANMENPLGSMIEMDDGRVYRYMKAGSAVAIGQTVSPSYAIVNQDVDAAASDATMTGTGDFVANAYADGAHYVTIDANTGIGQTRRIMANSANILYLDRAWTTALDATSDFLVWSMYGAVVPTPNAAHSVCGIAISAISSGYYGWFQVGGLCPMVRAAGNTDALVAGEGVCPSSSAGVCKGFTNAGTSADEAALSFGYSMVAWAAADSAATGVPVMIKGLL